MADAWTPEEDEVRIYFERIDGAEMAPRPIRASRAEAEPAFDEDDGQETVIPADIDARVKELCAALAEAERGGHASSPSSGSATPSCRARPSAGISIPSRARLCWQRPSSAAS